MSLSTLLGEVCALQVEHSDTNTSNMARRGSLIRDEIPGALRPTLLKLGQRAGISPEDVLMTGKDGAGRKAHVPWVRIASRTRSPSPTLGWYVVYLWRRDGTGVYLAIAHGSTEYRDGSFVPRDAAELRGHVDWARNVFSLSGMAQTTASSNVELRSRTALVRAYERSCPTSVFYSSAQMPPDSTLLDDLGNMMDLLGLIYEKERTGRAPSAESPEIRDALKEIETIASPLAARGQGPGLSAPERKAVELHAMHLAKAYLEQTGFAVDDCSAMKSYDLLAAKDGISRLIEVKGTTGSANRILLTANEVALHFANPGRNGLIIVHGIELTKGDVPCASGGTLLAQIPWNIERQHLRALSYSCNIQSTAGDTHLHTLADVRGANS